MKWWWIPFALLMLVAMTLRVATNHHGRPDTPVGAAWWFILGVALGLLAGFLTYLVAVQPRRWRVQIGTDGDSVSVNLTRTLDVVRIGTLDPATAEFDDRLYELVAQARQKATALEVAGR